MAVGDDALMQSNLAIVFGPNLLKSSSENMMTAAEDSQYINGERRDDCLFRSDAPSLLAGCADIFKKIISTPEAVVGPRCVTIARCVACWRF